MPSVSRGGQDLETSQAERGQAQFAKRTHELEQCQYWSPELSMRMQPTMMGCLTWLESPMRPQRRTGRVIPHGLETTGTTTTMKPSSWSPTRRWRFVAVDDGSTGSLREAIAMAAADG